jgi:hypothetical protein
MRQDQSKTFVNITGSLFVGIFIIFGTFLSISFSNEDKTGSVIKDPNPDTYWDESMCECLAEEEAEVTATVFLKSWYPQSFLGRVVFER